MKLTFATLVLSLSLSQAYAATASLFVKQQGQWLDVAEVIKEEAINDDNNSFCYKGDPKVVMASMKKWAKETENFFCDGCGGGFAFRKVKLLKSSTSVDINLIVEDEVVPGEERYVIIKACK